MNFTFTSLIIASKVTHSPFLINPSFSVRNTYLMKNIKMVQSISPFMSSYSKVIPKLEVFSSAFMNFVDSSISLESSEQYISGQQFDSNRNVPIDSIFHACRFVSCVIKGHGSVSATFISCYFAKYFASNNIDFEKAEICNCHFEESGPLHFTQSATIESTVFRKVDIQTSLVTTKHLNLQSNNYTENQCSQTLFSVEKSYSPMKFQLFSKNEIGAIQKCALFKVLDVNIDSSVFYQNNCLLFQSEVDSFPITITISNTCFDFGDSSALLGEDDQDFFEPFGGQMELRNCKINVDKDQMKNYIYFGCETSFSENGSDDSSHFKLNQCIFDSNQCDILNYEILTPIPERRYFDYKIIGVINEQFEYE